MRYIRQTVQLKDNKENTLLNEKQREKIEELKLQLKSVYAQANMLKQSNSKLLWKIEMMEKQIQSSQQIKEQLLFLREQEINYKQQLANHDQINQRLREELYKVEKDKNQLAERLKQILMEEQAKNSSAMQSNRSDQTVHNSTKNTKIQDYKSAKFSRDTSSRVSICLSTNNDKSKENHHSTPKSKIQINIDKIIPECPVQRKKVFF